uniref:PH domain-containing protein n=2 Tax=Esox lucius TaxID=8010 RepID=A0A3P8ZEN9_ESOLU
MSKLDEYGEWRRHWFVMGDAALSFYRDSEAEESHDLDGEIDLTDCVNVLDWDTDNNYGFQIHTKEAVFTLSASTSRIRRSWVKALRQAVQQPRPSPRQSDDSGRGRHGYRPPASPHSPPSNPPCEDSEPQSPSSTPRAHQMDSEDLDRMSSKMFVASQREAGEGWDREQAKRLEERNKWFEEGIPFSDRGGRWESLELKTGGVPLAVTHTMDVDVSKKWAELESLSFREMSELSLIGAQTNQSHETIPNGTTQTILTTSAMALQREALSLRQQVKGLRMERVAMGTEVEGMCGPGAPCSQRLEAMEEAHHRALKELQESHARQIRDLQAQRDRLLQEESKATAQAVEALNWVHSEELVREVEKARRMPGGQAHVDPTYNGQMPQADAFSSELDVLSERYSQKCLELSRAEQSGKDRETELNRMEREMEQLCKENKELQARLTEEISRMRCFIMGQRSACVSPGNCERSPSELEMLLRAKENEVVYLQKEVSCLRNEVQSLTMEKQNAWDRYKEVYVELSAMKGTSELEIRNLKEHLRLANAALQEGGRDT